MQLTQDQATAMSALQHFIATEEEQVFILTGYAGTGKTFLIHQLIGCLVDQKIRLQVMAPTGRAAKVLNTDMPGGVLATTIHKAIYLCSMAFIDEDEKLHFPIRRREGNVKVFIVDEASMVSSKVAKHELMEFGSGVLIDDLLTYVRPHHGGKVLFVGDPAQLPPVGDNRSVALEEQFFVEKGLRVRTCRLTTIVRQKTGSQILKAATVLRNLLETSQRNMLVIERKEGEVMDMDNASLPQQFVADQREGRTAVICYSNRQALAHNNAIRKLLFTDNALICPGEKLMVVRNSYNVCHGSILLLNGDIVTVLEVDDKTVTQSAPVKTEEGGVCLTRTVSLQFQRVRCRTEGGKDFWTYVIVSLLRSELSTLSIEEMRALFINLKIRAFRNGITPDRSPEAFCDFMMKDEFYNALWVKYGYAFTCHKAQGSEWENVFVDFTGRTGLDTDSIRWKYTAVTRAKQRLYCIQLPDIRPMDNLQVLSVKQGQRVRPSKVEVEQTEGSPFHSSDSPILASKYWSVVSNMRADDDLYRVESVESFPYMERYTVRTPHGTIEKVECYYVGSGLFVKYVVSDGDEKLRAYFEDETDITYKISYRPESESLDMLKSKMESLCEELGIKLLAIEPNPWQVTYCMRTSGGLAAVKFHFNREGKITRAEPRSEEKSTDLQLTQLVDRLMDERTK